MTIMTKCLIYIKHNFRRTYFFCINKNYWRLTVEEEVSLVDIYNILKKGINLILIATIFAVGGMCILNAFFIDPVYQSTTQILVNSTTSTSDEIDTNEIQTNIQLIETYSVIIESPAVLDEVVSRIDSDVVTVTSLQNAITVSSESNTQVMNITVEGENPENTALIANTTAEVFQEEIVDIMQVENVTILSPATVGEKVKPNAVRSTLVAAGVGLALGIVITFIREYLDTTIKDEETITEMFEIPVLGTITDFELMDEISKNKKQT